MDAEEGQMGRYFKGKDMDFGNHIHLHVIYKNYSKVKTKCSIIRSQSLRQGQPLTKTYCTKLSWKTGED